jgi:hypothetical protein
VLTLFADGAESLCDELLPEEVRVLPDDLWRAAADERRRAARTPAQGRQRDSRRIHAAYDARPQ